MNTKKIWANFSVQDVSVTRKFYTQLGFKSNTPHNHPKLASFFFGDDNFVIHFFENNSQIDEYLSSNANNNSEVIFTLSAQTEQEVIEWSHKVKAAGGNIYIEPGRDKTGYYGFAFADPDGHKFNVLLMEEGM